MSSEKYFSQYESPNIVIIPAKSDNASSPKRRKIGNNIIVPIVNNATCEKKFKSTQENKPDNTNTVKKIDKNEGFSSRPLKVSWASNYLQSIGLNNKSPIWNRRIPRKTDQRSIVLAEPAKIVTTEVTPNTKEELKSTINKHTPISTPKSLMTNLNILEDFDAKIKNYIDIKKRKLKGKSIESKQESRKSVSDRNITAVNNKKIFKTSNAKKNESNKPPKNLYHKSKKCEKDIKSKSQKDVDSKLLKRSLAKEKTQYKVEKSNIKSVVVKRHVQNKKKFNVEGKQNQSKSDSAQHSSSNYTSKYTEAYKHTKSSKAGVNFVKNVKITKKDDISDSNKLTVPKEARYNSEPKSKIGSSKTKHSSKTKGNEKIKETSNSASKQKTINSPIKRKTPKIKDYRRIKLVVNLICNNNSNPPKCNESTNNDNNSSSRTCSVSNVDLDFLNDLDIDEIVKSLDTCDKKTSQCIENDQELHKNKGNIDKPRVTSTTVNNNNNNSDVLDLIKTLKGEEDDDLMRISLENTKDLLSSSEIRSTVKENCYISHKVFNNDNSKITKNHPTKLIKRKEERKIYISEAIDTISNNRPNSVKNADVTIGSIDGVNTYNINTNESTIKKQTPTLKIVEESKLDNNQLSPIINSTLSMEVDDNKRNIIMKEETNLPISDIVPIPKFGKINTDLCHEVKLQEGVTKNINNERCEYVKTLKNASKVSNSLEEQSVEIIDIKDKNKSRISAMNTAKETVDTGNVHNIREGNTNNTGISNITKLESSDDDVIYVGEQKQDVKNNDIQKNDVVDSANHKIVPQLNTLNVVPLECSENKNTLLDKLAKEKTKFLDKQAPINNHESEKEQNIDHNDKKNSQTDLRDNNTTGSQNTSSNSDEKIHSNLTHKDDLETFRRIEQQLYINSGSKYSVTSLINSGRFSKIFKCKHPNGKYYALKMQKQSIAYTLGKKKKSMLESLVNDMESNNLFIVCLTKAFNVVDKWYYLMEYYPKNLDQVLMEAGKPFPIEKIQDYARQLVMAVMVLRNKNMVHMDIIPKHILINSSNNLLKLCGFDNLCYIDKMKVLPNLGTVNYRAPEVILGYESGFEIDVWSTGLVLYEMAANQKLFPGIYNNDILYKQICTLGCVPNDMIKKSRFGCVHFAGSKFMRKSGFKGQNVKIVSKFYKNNKLCDTVYHAYFENWGTHRSESQQNADIGKLSLFVKLLQQMLTVRPESRLPVEFVYANPFIYDAYSYQEW